MPPPRGGPWIFSTRPTRRAASCARGVAPTERRGARAACGQRDVFNRRARCCTRRLRRGGRTERAARRRLRRERTRRIASLRARSHGGPAIRAPLRASGAAARRRPAAESRSTSTSDSCGTRRSGSPVRRAVRADAAAASEARGRSLTQELVQTAPNATRVGSGAGVTPEPSRRLRRWPQIR